MGTYSCTCGHRDLHFDTFNTFWKTVSIRTKTAFQYNQKIVDLYNKQHVKNFSLSEKVNLLKENLFIEFFESQEYEKISRNLFSQIVDHYKTELEELLISLIFLTHSDKNSAKISFKKLVKYYKPDYLTYLLPSDKSENTFDTETQTPDEKNSTEKKLYIRKISLFDILKIYVNIVTLFSVDLLSELSTEKEDFTISMKEEFSEENQEEFLKNKLDSFGKEKEMIAIDDFFEKEYISLSNDILVRNGVSFSNHSKSMGIFSITNK